MKKTLFISSIFLLLLSSCQQDEIEDLEIKNNTNTTTLEYNNYGAGKQSKTSKDTIGESIIGGQKNAVRSIDPGKIIPPQH